MVTTSKRILVIDDSPVVLAMACHALAEAGYHVETRSSVEEVESGPVAGFDLILMDVQMPQLYGDDVGMALRYQRGVKSPIYLFSTLDDEELKTRASDTGLDGFISKQAGMDHLIAEVRKILGT